MKKRLLIGIVAVVSSLNGTAASAKANDAINIGLPFYLKQRAVLYSQPDVNAPRVGATVAEGQRVFIKQKYDNNFFLINTWLGDRYIQIPESDFKLETEKEKVDITSRTELYTVPFTNYKTGGSLAPQNNVQIISKFKDWSKVKTWSGERWIKNSIETSKVGDLTTLKPSSVYKEDSIYSDILTELPENTIVEATKQKGDWFYIETNSGRGWIKNETFNIAEGKMEPIDEHIVLKEPVPLLVSPNDSAKTGATLTPQTVLSTSRVGDYYIINTWLGPRYINLKEKQYAYDLKTSDYYGVKINADKAIWVWDTANNLSTENVDKTLRFLVKNHINIVFLNFKTGMNGQIAHFIEECSKYNISVHTNNGTPGWALAVNQGKGTSLINNIISYNASVPKNQQFKGIHMDVEPYNSSSSGSSLPEWDSNRNQLLHEWIKNSNVWKQQANDAGLEYSASLPAWLDTSANINEYFIPTDGEKVFYEQMLDSADFSVLMSYRQSLTGSNSLSNLVEGELKYARDTGKEKGIMLALQTNLAEGCSYCSFYGKPYADSESLFKEVDDYYVNEIGYKGVSMHDLNSYLEKSEQEKLDNGKSLPY